MRQRTRRTLCPVALALTTALASLGLSLPACSTGQPAETPVAFDAVRAWNDLERIVAFGPRPSGSEAIEELRQFLESELQALDLTPVREAFTATTPAGPIDMVNVYADLEAEPHDGHPAPLVIICAHFDTKRFDFEFVGANDGGSATAVVLELARALTASKGRKFSYRFLFLDGEEAIRLAWQDPDNRYGSKYHAEQLKKSNDYGRIEACVLLDMVGDADLAFERDDYSDPMLQKVFFDAARDLKLERHIAKRRQAIKDDHLSFMEIGIKSVDLIDLTFGPNNSFWHTAEDRLDKCSRMSLDKTGRIVLRGLAALEAKHGKH